ncbi:MAG: alpha/beta hydrolase [Oscillospiraceae bacterium]|nr:alpha/beta hydrolase [Oscillospiraceae bacterium]MBQ5340973.1 alpha/beta hydrolase [Oscillospiraceae bacterium]MBQ5342614.1 alpha/beta hydrolase [Oscillospiraceae bacterium]
MKGFYKGLLAATGLFAVYVAGAGATVYANAMIRSSSKPDRNYDPEEEKEYIIPTEKSSQYRQAAYNYNIWWNTRDREFVEIMSTDGLRLRGSILRAENDKAAGRIAIVVHGHLCCAGEEGFISKMFHDAGYDVLAVDQRAHGKSDGETLTMGRMEAADVVEWARYAADRYPDEKIVLYGASMGGNSVLRTADRALPKNVVCIIDDCGYCRADEAILQSLRHDFSGILFKEAVNAACSVTYRILQGASIKNTDASGPVSRAKVPVLFIHGTDDSIVDCSDSRRLYALHPGKKKLLIFDGVKHNCSFFSDRERYTQEVFDFIDSCCEG